VEKSLWLPLEKSTIGPPGNNIRDVRPYFRPSFCHSSVAQYTSFILQ